MLRCLSSLDVAGVAAACGKYLKHRLWAVPTYVTQPELSLIKNVAGGDCVCERARYAREREGGRELCGCGRVYLCLSLCLSLNLHREVDPRRQASGTRSHGMGLGLTPPQANITATKSISTSWLSFPAILPPRWCGRVQSSGVRDTCGTACLQASLERGYQSGWRASGWVKSEGGMRAEDGSRHHWCGADILQ